MDLNDGVEVSGGRRPQREWKGPRPRVSKSIEVASALRNGYQREFDRRGVVSTGESSPTRLGRRGAVAEAHEGQRELVDAIRAD
jgi:hypothetical protein